MQNNNTTSRDNTPSPDNTTSPDREGGDLSRRLRIPAESEIRYSSNCVRLSPGEWVVATIVVAAVACLTPLLWQRAEKFEPGPDYRVPYDLSSDYYLYRRYSKLAVGRYETLVIGDSVVWGHYVSMDNTLCHYLNELAGRDAFANLGLDGIHPAALDGLLRYYGRDIKNKNVILHLNPLWMSSPKQDLQTEKEHDFHHPKLVAQFTPKILCYKASFSQRMSVVLERYVPLFNWVSHINTAYFQSMDVPAWTIEHPSHCPLKAVTFRLPTSDDYEQAAGPPRPVGNNVLDWVSLKTSLQWRFFKRSVELLRHRNNKVFVLVGPFNEHILAPESIEVYRKMQVEIEAWLRQNNVPYYMPAVLPAEFYCDASHPTSRGYAELAKQLFQNDSLTEESAVLSPGRD
jgi:hypothetical protein